MNARIALLLAAAAAVAACKGEPPPPPAPAPALTAQDANDPKKLLAAVDAASAQLKDKPKTFEVLLALGNLYYENGRYLEAVDSFRQALAVADPIAAAADALRAKGVKPAKELPPECRRSPPEYGLEQIAAQAKKLAATAPPAALRCYDEALVQTIKARALRGNSLYLVGQPEGARREHLRVLQQSPDYPESLFFVGAITLEQSRGDKAQLAEGKKYWRRLLEVAPGHPRAAIVRESLPRADELFTPKPEAAAPAPGPVAPGPVAANGSALPPGHPPLDSAAPPPQGNAPMAGNVPGAPLAHTGATSAQLAAAGPNAQAVSGMAEAAAQTEHTPELEKGLDDLTAQTDALLDAGKYQEARDTIVRVMPMRPNDARTAAEMGGAMRGLGRAEMAERVLGHALQLDPKQPRALYELGRLYASRGDKAQAAQSFKAVQSADAKFAAAHDVAGELKRLQ